MTKVYYGIHQTHLLVTWVQRFSTESTKPISIARRSKQPSHTYTAATTVRDWDDRRNAVVVIQFPLDLSSIVIFESPWELAVQFQKPEKRFSESTVSEWQFATESTKPIEYQPDQSNH